MIIRKCQVLEDTPSTFLDQVLNQSQAIPAIIDIDSISVSSYDTDTGLLAYTADFVVADTMEATFQLDEGWNRDKRGWNSNIVCGGEYWPEGGKTYRLEFSWFFGDGYIVRSVYEVQCIELFGS
mgnify:CR=1 FL=1